jgi:hypothetical protein
VKTGVKTEDRCEDSVKTGVKTEDRCEDSVKTGVKTGRIRRLSTTVKSRTICHKIRASSSGRLPSACCRPLAWFLGR